MQIFLDVDGVLLNFEETFVQFLNRYWGQNLPAGYRANQWDFADIMPPEKMHAAWQDFVSSESCAQMPPLVNPVHFNEQTQGCSVHLLTNFPLMEIHRRWNNLNALGFCYQGLHYCGLQSHGSAKAQPKSAAIQQLRQPELPAIFVDDHSENCKDVVQHCPQVEVWLMDCRFNRDFHHHGIKRSFDWSTLFERMRQLRCIS